MEIADLTGERLSRMPSPRTPTSQEIMEALTEEAQKEKPWSLRESTQIHSPELQSCSSPEEDPNTTVAELTEEQERVLQERELTALLLPKSFRMRSRNLFLTYPRCLLSAERSLELLKGKFERKRILYAVVAQEYHGDGTPHIHALVILASALDTSNARFADIDGYHGNYRAARYPSAVETYVKKAGSYITHGNRDALREAKQTAQLPISQRLADRICSGSTLPSLISTEEFRGFCLTRLRQIQAFEEAVVKSMNVEILSPLPPYLATLEGNALLVSNWLKDNLSKGSRPLRSPQLFLYGPPRMGKTLLCNLLSSSIRTYFPPIGEKYFDGISDATDLIIFDEGIGSHPLTQMLQILDGQKCTLPQRYKSFYKTRNVPVVCLSNLHPRDIYKNCDPIRIEAFLDRFLIIHVTEFLKVFDIVYTN